jgi:hypothetical protein
MTMITNSSSVPIRLRLLDPKDHEIGVLLLLLKDLWTGDLPLGGEISVGRGRLAGKSAELRLQRDGGEQVWRISAENGALRVEGDRQQLESFVSERLRGYFAPSQAGDVNATVRE